MLYTVNFRPGLYETVSQEMVVSVKKATLMLILVG